MLVTTIFNSIFYSWILMHNEIFLLPSIFDSYIYEMKCCFCIFTQIWNEMKIKQWVSVFPFRKFNFGHAIEQDQCFFSAVCGAEIRPYSPRQKVCFFPLFWKKIPLKMKYSKKKIGKMWRQRVGSAYRFVPCISHVVVVDVVVSAFQPEKAQLP